MTEYLVGCKDGYHPNMEGRRDTVVQCLASPDDRSLVNWSFKNSFDCVSLTTSNRNSPACNLPGITWYSTENFVRKDNTPSAEWSVLRDSNGAFIRLNIHYYYGNGNKDLEHGFPQTPLSTQLDMTMVS